MKSAAAGGKKNSKQITWSRTISVLDVYAASLACSYPSSSPLQSDLRLQMLYYASSGKAPRVSDYTTCASDSLEKACHGPYAVHGQTRKSTKSQAITSYLRSSGIAKLAPDSTLADSNPLDKHLYPKQVHFVVWNPKNKDALLKNMLLRLHAGETQLYKDDFAVVLNSPHENGWAMCRHEYNDPLDELDASDTDRNRRAVMQHVTACLGKRFVDRARTPGSPEDTRLAHCDAYEWANGLKSSVPKDERPADAIWFAHHPMFKRTTARALQYRVLSASERAVLPKAMIAIWEKLQDKTFTNEEMHRLVEFTNLKFHTLVTVHSMIAAGDEQQQQQTPEANIAHVSPLQQCLSLMDKWSFFEKFYFITNPPMPVSSASTAQRTRTHTVNADAHAFAEAFLHSTAVVHYVPTKQPRGAAENQVLDGRGLLTVIDVPRNWQSPKSDPLHVISRRKAAQQESGVGGGGVGDDEVYAVNNYAVSKSDTFLLLCKLADGESKQVTLRFLREAVDTLAVDRMDFVVLDNVVVFAGAYNCRSALAFVAKRCGLPIREFLCRVKVVCDEDLVCNYAQQLEAYRTTMIQ